MSDQNYDEIIRQITDNKKKYTEYNSSKIKSLNASLADPALVNLFNYIPFLFTVNQPEFPGYIKEIKNPHGIANYQIPSTLLSHIRSTNPSFILQKSSENEPVIRLLALIGSAGTIAFTPDSDFDFWICGNFSTMDPADIILLRRKCRMIEEWVMEHHRKEVHFFLNDIEHIKKNIFDEDEEYGLSGTSLGQLLKEEFYRSSIMINQMYPFWWVVPADCSDAEYDELLSAVRGSSIEKEFIDLGNLSSINRGDFLIAALFQIIKSLGNPFKSIIKLGLLERYIHDDKLNPFISNLIKKNVLEGKNDRLSVDAYCIMFDQVYDYYQKHIKDMTSINIIKTCFYLKVNPRLSYNERKTGNEDFRETMIQYTKKWGWDNTTIRHVDNFETWDIDSTNKMMNNTKKKILNGYKNILTALGTELNAGSIDRESLMSINRKIYSHFSPEDNKIDNTLNFKKYPPEKLLSLDYIRDVKGNEAWYLNKRIIAANKPVKVLIRKSRHLISLIVWISLNGLYQKNFSRLEIEQGFYNLDPNFIRDLITELSDHFTLKSVNLQNSYFLRDPFPVMSYVVINPFMKYSKKLDDIYFIYHNSWGETRFEVFQGEKDLPDIAARIINGALVSGMDDIGALRFAASEPFSTSKEFLYIKTTLKSMLSFFTRFKTPVKQRYLTMLSGKYYIFSTAVKRGGASPLSYMPCSSEPQMLYSISYNRGILNRLMVDEKVPELAYISEMLSYNSDDSVKIFFDNSVKYCRFFVLNERGSLMLFRKQSRYFNHYLASLVLFAESAVEQIMKAAPESALAKGGGVIKVFKITKDSAGKTEITEHALKSDFDITRYRETAVRFKLSLHILETGEVGYRFSLPDGGYSEIFSRSEIESVSRELAALSESVEGYHYFPDSVNLENAEINLYQRHTSFAFSEKNRFEMLVEKSLGIF